MRIKVHKKIQVPDPIAVERYRRAPDFGPRILFFSGGSSLRELSERLIYYTHNSIHLITPFDSGGSSAVLRKAFNMIAVGDLRNRLLALADRLAYGNSDIHRLFTYRFSKFYDTQALRSQLHDMVLGRHELVSSISGPLQSLICNHLGYLYEQLPDDFNLQGANIGNLILVGGYLNNNRNIEPALFLFERLAEVRGIVKPISKENLHLISILEDGTVLAGQNLLTGKEFPPIHSKVSSFFLSEHLEEPLPTKVKSENSIKNLISQADLIVFPMGSYYSSLLVNLLPEGIGEAIAQSDCLKVFIPNTFNDPEQYGMSFEDTITTLLLILDPLKQYPIDRLLNYLILDTKQVHYQGENWIIIAQKLGIGIIDTKLAVSDSNPCIDPEELIKILLSLA